MKNKFCIFYLFLFQSLAMFSQAPAIDWEKSYGGSDMDEAHDIHQTSDGGYIIAGYSTSTDINVTGNHGNYDYWILKIDFDGDVEWEKSFGGSDVDWAESIQETSDHGFIIAGYSFSSDGDVTYNHGGCDYWIVKIDSIGNLEWENTFGGSDWDEAFRIIETNDGGCLVTGFTRSNDGDITFNHGDKDYWIIKLDSSGNLQWQKTLGGSGADSGCYSEQTSDDGYIVIGGASSNDGDVTGNHGEADCWVIKLDSEGNIIWQKSFGGSKSDGAWSIHEISDKGFIIGGYSNSNDGDVSGHHGTDYYSDLWIVRLDSNANILWQKSIGGSNWDGAYSLNETIDGGYVTVGWSGSNDGDVTGIHGTYDLWVVRLDENGIINWQKCLGGSVNDFGFAGEQTTDHGFIMAGWGKSNDGDITENLGYWDYWIIKLLPDCDYNLFFADEDDDGTGDPDNYIYICEDSIPGYVNNSFDCNDEDYLINPDGIEICNSNDDDCNGIIDDGFPVNFYYADIDGDLFGDNTSDSLSCTVPLGYILDNTDCNDSNALIYPAALETCNLLDDNCNALIDEGLILNTFYADVDGDNYGDADATIISCFEDVPDYISDSTDCDDANNLIYPGAEEICNYLDDDCDGVIDDNLAYIHSYQDADGDDFGNIEIDSLACIIPEGFVEDDSDCDDTNPAIYPGAEETLNGIDDNCNELIDEGLAIENNLFNEIKIYPNPATDILQIDYSGNETGEIEILNIAGENIYSDKLTAHLTINIQNLPAGIYLLKIVSTENQGVFNFVKE